MAANKERAKSIHLVGGADEFTIKETAAKLANGLAPKGAGEFGIEIIEGDAGNQDEALKIIARLREALDTVGLFGGGEKLVWLKNTSLLADNQTTRAEAVKEALADFADLLKRGLSDGVTLLISAIGCDRRKTLYKAIEKLGEVRFFETLEEGKGDSDEEIEAFIQSRLHADGKTMNPEAVQAFRELVAPSLREIANELEKLFLYVGKRREITADDVRAICSATRQAVIWELTDALGARRIRRAIGALENLLDAGESSIGVLMMLAAQFRLMLLAKDLMQRQVIEVRDGPGANFQFVKAFERLPEEATAHFPRTKEGNLPNAWRLHRCALAAKNFSTEELIRAMELLLEANRQLVSTQLDDRLVLEETMAKIARK
ncbi:MAG TPA: DNA polymerase III subunit delta [Verrucomicrobiae bacterium]|nr:DNA polymerase III subunit delta [Verrucomicrobiae bacterium]